MRGRLLEPPRPASPAGNGRGATGPEPIERRRPGMLLLASIVLVIVAAATATAYAVSMTQQPVYRAEAEILFRLGATDTQRSERELETQKIILVGRDTLAPIAENQGRTVADLQAAVDVEAVGESDVLRLGVEDHEPARALATAEAVVGAYVLAVADVPSDIVHGLAGRTDERSRSLRQLGPVTVDLGPESSARLHLLAAPAVLENPVAPDRIRATAGGMIIGILVAVAFVFGVAMRRDSGAGDRR